ncbi:MAG: DNA mismatch repair protein MutS, partial [Clostridia bacterium]|nr:DNA mismatch repair protein MutS [Clostridia bacterium]
LQREHGFFLTPKFELSVPRANRELLEKAEGIAELERTGEDYMNIVFEIRDTDEVYDIRRRKEALDGLIEEEEMRICAWLSREISAREETLTANCGAIARLDLDMAKCLYAARHACTKPVICADHRLAIEEGRNLQVEDALRKQGRNYLPVSIELSDGVTAITGANMGGKTISLKMITQCALMAQYAMYVPAKRMEAGLSAYIHVLIGDSQNVQRGLSSFGSEMEELKEILDNAQDRSIIMIDEIASGTNPAEGFALTKSFMKYFSKKPYITIITTHFDHAASGEEVRNLQVKGLSGADFGKLARELSTANRRQRIEILGKYMDYRLIPVNNAGAVPRDALNIAKILGIYDEIIDEARLYLI